MSRQHGNTHWQIGIWIALAIAAAAVWWLKLSAVWLFVILMIACHLGHRGMHGHATKQRR